MNRFRLKACGRCGGDLAQDEGDWICLQCGTYYYVGLYPSANFGPAKWLRQPPDEKAARAARPEPAAFPLSAPVFGWLLGALIAGAGPS
ncbi:MAG: hypothetical protein ACE5Q6_10085 [Dehalococcoidia bacterium]